MKANLNSTTNQKIVQHNINYKICHYLKTVVFGGFMVFSFAAHAQNNHQLKNGIYMPVVGEGKYILTPPVHPTPQINGPSVFGVRPGSPFLYTIPATGKRPMKFYVDGLPKGLKVDGYTGIISGKITSIKKQEYKVVLRATNHLGKDQKAFTIKVGNTICLTPPMGWNSWNCWKQSVTQDKVLASAQAMVDKGLINYGWTYINIDDTWQGKRGGKYNAIQPDLTRFPDIKAMCDKIHALGLKAGIYSTPWMTSYAGHVGGSSNNPEGKWDKATDASETDKKTREHWEVGKYSFDNQDAKQWANWGIDYLKYDWNPNDSASTVRMANALNNSGRDIIYSLSNSAPIANAALYARVANCWRTAGDLKGRWDQPGAHLNLRTAWKLHRTWMEKGERGGPGHFPDADMLVVGDVITGTNGSKPIPSRLTADEQYTQISLWTLWSCPLLIGCPIETLDKFTLNLLTNAEVLAIHQDAVAIPGTTVYKANGFEIIVKNLEDGGKAVGLFNVNNEAKVITANWKTLGLKGSKTIRDVWRQKDIGEFSNSFSAQVPAHGAVLIHIK